eukprot:m.28361 g.28361  ORF g.28361 m.28361 type:complete len:97 (+) comp11835_c0_seq1:137-427(+)
MWRALEKLQLSHGGDCYVLGRNFVGLGLALAVLDVLLCHCDVAQIHDLNTIDCISKYCEGKTSQCSSESQSGHANRLQKIPHGPVDKRGICARENS